MALLVMTYFKASLRRTQGVDHSDYVEGVYCNGADEATARAQAEQQHPGFHCQSLETSHVAIVATTEALASQWLCEIIACCQPGITAGQTHFGSINMHALSSSESLADAYFDEVHVVTTKPLTSEEIELFRTCSKHFFLHAFPSHQSHYSPQHKVINWASDSDLIAFLGLMFSAKELSLFPISFAEKTINRGLLRLLHSHEPTLENALDCLLDQVGNTDENNNNGLIFVMGGCEVTLGDYATTCLALEGYCSEDSELTATIFCTTAKKSGYKLWLLLDNPKK
jgi:hypothetical protein